jgi:retron-type reverse transcriptase
MVFDVSDKIALAKLLGVSPREIDYVASRLRTFYKTKSHPKTDGTFRKLFIPRGKLKELQLRIKEKVLDVIPLLPCAHGGVKHRSVISNASVHVGQPIVFSVDIKSFFPSISPTRVEKIFISLGFGGDAAALLKKLTTWNFELPQGAHTSPSIANLSLRDLDKRIFKLSRVHSFAYTRYVDDLTVSGGYRLLKFRRLLQRIVESEGFSVKPEKTITMHAGMRQVVTKLVVNGKINLSKEQRNEIRKEFLQALTNYPDQPIPASTRGRVAWLQSVNPELGKKLELFLARRQLSISS